MHHLISRKHLQKNCSAKQQFYTKVWPSRRLVTHVLTIWAKYKDVIPDVSDFTQNIAASCKSKLRLSELKDLNVKSTEKLVKDECM